jgi:queuosine precursor transporter
MVESDVQKLNLQGHKAKEFKYLVIFSMMYMTIILANIILTNRYVSLWGDFFVLGGTLTSPFFFILSDIIAELFGYNVSKQIIWAGFSCQIIFALICEFVIHMPYPGFFKDSAAYTLIFGQLFRLVLDSFVAFIIASLANVYIITKWKTMLNGRYFWLRSLGSSTLAEALYSTIAILMMEISAVPLGDVFKVILISYLIKVIYAVIFAGPANLFVNYIKRTTQIDIYDNPLKHINPFKKNKNTVIIK